MYSQAKALAEKNQRDLQAQREQAERHVSWCSEFFFPFYSYGACYSSPIPLKTGVGFSQERRFYEGI